MRSNTPLAALTGLNEPIFVEAAQALALRVLREGGRTTPSGPTMRSACARRGSRRPAERDAILDLLQSRRQRLAEGWLECARSRHRRSRQAAGDCRPDTTPQDAAAWTLVARVLLNLDETITKN